MKAFLLLLLILSSYPCLQAQNTDLPSPISNLQTVPSGSYVIAMDNTNQLNNSSMFNHKSYGLIVTLLNNSVKVKWVITAGKVKDGIDFTVNASKIIPSTSAASTYNFKAGPFVIFAADTTGVAAIINGFNNGISNVNDKIKVYQTNASVTADIRYDLTGFVPKAAILTDGGNQAIHTTYMSACNVPVSNYQTANGGDLLTKCFTFASEPHNSNTGPEVDDAISAIKRFVEFGGNFLAQCEAVQTYENNILGRFQTTTGITDANSTAGTAISYPNPDLSFSQFEGNFSISIGGSLQNWRINASPANNFHKHARANADTTVIGASVSKHKTGSGGLVFYIGNHNFDNYTSLVKLNGLRMYMNAFLTPVSIADSCQIGTVYMNPLAVKLISFQGFHNNSGIKLTWSVEKNESSAYFEVEKSLDGVTFTHLARITATVKSGRESYEYNDPVIAEKNFYRIKLINKTGFAIYSKNIQIQTNTRPGHEIRLISNPVNNNLCFEFCSSVSLPLNIQVIDMTGVVRLKYTLPGFQGTNVFNLPLSSTLQKGMYLLTVVSEGRQFGIKFIKQ